MLRRALLTLACVLAIALPGIAQEQTGTIEGVVKDSSGAILPGVTVELTNVNRGAVAGTAITDAAGRFRFVGLLPGKYEAVAKLQGFSPGKVENIDLRLGQLLHVELALSVGNVAETVQVTAESPILDTKQSARGTNIRAEQLELVPHGRDFSTLVTQAPGANQEAKLGGISIDGASASENRFIVDGIETTNLQTGVSAKSVIADFIEEVQVKSSGYTAEYGGATGGVINVQTKSGTNNLHGSGLLYWEGDKTSGGQSPAFGYVFDQANTSTGVESLRTSLTNDDVAEYVKYPEDSYNRVEPAFSLGGPIVRDKAWFFGAYQPALTKITRDVTAASAKNPDASSSSTTQKRQIQYITASQTAQISNSIRTRVAFNNSWEKRKGLLAALTGLDPEGTNYSKTTVYPNWSVSANADWVVSPNFVLGVRGGYFTSDQNDSNVTEEPRIRWTTTSNVGLPGVPLELQRGTGFSSIPTNLKVDYDKQTRANFQANATWYANFAGSHQFKGGVQFDRVGNNVLSGESRNLVTIRWNTALSSGVPFTRGPFGYYEVRSNGVAPEKGFITEGNIHTNNIGLFIQDAWTIGSRLTVNLGLRTERERVPTYTVGEDIPEFGIEFDFKDKVAPRAGFAYDIRGDGKWKASGSWGVFYDIFKLELPRGSFGGDKWLSYYYTLDTPDWRSLIPAGCPPACSGTLIRGPIDFRRPSFGADAIEPNLKPMRSQEVTFGLDHELSPIMALSARYVHKQIDRAIEDAGSQDAAGNEIYITANPGEGLTELAFADPLTKLPKPKRDYDALELAFEKRFASNWFLRTTYTLSRLYGNYSGLSQGDESGRTSPNVGRLYDFTEIMFDGNINPLMGRLPTDRPHQWKTQFIYAFTMGTTVGLSEYVASGVPVTREVGIFPTSNYPFMWRGRMSDGRTDVFSQTDLLVSHDLKLGSDKRLRFEMNVQNLFNQSAAVSKYSTYHKTNGIRFDPADFYNRRLNFDALIAEQGVEQDPRFLLNSAFQSPILARFGVKFLF